MAEVSSSRGLFSHPGLLVAGAAAFAMSTLFSALKPVLLTRFLEETNWGESGAGLAVAMPFLGIAVSSLLFYLRPPRQPLRRLALVFGCVLVFVELASAALFHYQFVLLAMQLVGGLCVGVLMSATSRLVAVTESSAASFGFIDMTAVALMSVMVAGVGACVAYAGVAGGYLFAAVLASLYAGLVVGYREPDHLQALEQRSGTSLVLGLKPIAVLLMGLCFVTSSGMGFAFMFTLAANLGLAYDAAGSRIGLLLLASALACQMGGYCSARFGPRYPLLAGFAFCALGWWLAIRASTPLEYFLGLVPAVFALQFNFPILLALSGSLDSEGRWASIAAPLITSGFAWAAILAGVLVEGSGLQSLALATVCGMFFCACLLYPATRPEVAPLMSSVHD